MPYAEILDIPTMRDIKEELDMHVLCGEDLLGRQMSRVLVGAMEVREAIHDLEDDCLVITPGNRTDLISLIIKVQTGRVKSPKRVAGLILSGGVAPKRRAYSALKSAGIPTLLSRLDTYDVAARVHDLTVKIKYRDNNKVKLAIDMVEKHVDLDMVISNLG
jgi:BioD-like phosphotransacetylase family protein